MEKHCCVGKVDCGLQGSSLGNFGVCVFGSCFFVIVLQQALVAPSIVFLLPLVLANIFSWQLLDDVKELGNPSEQLLFPLKSYLMYILTFVLILKC